MPKFDSPWKEVLDAYFEAFLEFFFPKVHAGVDWSRGYESLDKELRKIVRDAEQGLRVADKLVKVWLRNGEEKWVLVHVEVQNQGDAAFPQRMFVYNYRLFDRYNREVVSLAVLGDERPNWRPSGFRYELFGCRVSIEFPTVKLVDYAEDWESLEASDNPFATVVMAHLKALETQKDVASRHMWKLQLIKALYERGMEKKDVRQLFRFIDWLMDLPVELEDEFWNEVVSLEEEKKMTYVSTGERVGYRKGRQDGIQEGREEGREEGLLRGIEIALHLKFGDDGSEVLDAIRQIQDADSLQTILQAIQTANTLDELRQVIASLNGK